MAISMTRSSPGGHDLPIRLLGALAPWRNAPVWHVGFSGGLDSTVLLHLLAELARRERLPDLKAIHVHHGLQAVAEEWPEHCRQVCQALDVPLQMISVSVEPGASIEQAAREARYAAFSGQLGVDEVLLTGQHRDDQAETMLFRLMRGAGVRGLAAMPESRVLGKGHLVRPLFDCARMELEEYAREHCLNWIEDPSNNDVRFSRNFLRAQVMPLLTSRWPQAVSAMARTARHLGEAQVLLGELAEQDLADAQATTPFAWLGLPVLAVQPLTGLSTTRQRNALRHWLAPLTRLPDTDHWAGWDTLRDAGQGAQPLWRLADGELHRTQGHVWWLAGLWLCTVERELAWPDPRQPLTLPGNGRIWIQGDAPQGPLEVRYRQGSEVVQVTGRGHRDLKRLFNEYGVPGFVRGRLPLLYCNDQLLAVAGLAGLDASPNGSWQLRWEAPTSDQSLS